jgi:RNA polymerase sigma factor (sigma-70 family)
MGDRGHEGSVVPLRGRRRERPQTSARELAHLSDAALLALIARADEHALAELYRRFGRLAYGLAFRILRDDALAQDAVQEGFLGVWRGAERFTADRAKPSTWLLTLVHRRAVDLVRREERRRTEPLEPEAEAMKAAPGDEAEFLTQKEAIRGALRQLPPEQREAIELAYYGGYTQSELAERLGQPLGTIKSRMFTGLSRLRDLLGEDARAQFGPG